MTRLSAALVLILSLAVSARTFRAIVRRYGTLLGFPWLLSIAFAAAAVAAVFALHVLLDP